MAAAPPAVSCVRALSTGPAKSLYGTVAPHSSYIFLHADKPPSQFASRVMTPIQRELQLRTMKWGAIVNLAWADRPPQVNGDGTSATVFSALRGRLEIPRVSLENINEVEAEIEEHIQGGPIQAGTEEQVHLYICTHGARDCRCGEHGSQVARALKEEVERRSLGETVKVREVAHVGGHEHAANLLIYPLGEWLGRLRPDDIPNVLNVVLAQPVRPFTNQDSPIIPEHWRGRMGLKKAEQIHLLENFL